MTLLGQPVLGGRTRRSRRGCFRPIPQCQRVNGNFRSYASSPPELIAGEDRPSIEGSARRSVGHGGRERAEHQHDHEYPLDPVARTCYTSFTSPPAGMRRRVNFGAAPPSAFSVSIMLFSHTVQTGRCPILHRLTHREWNWATGLSRVPACRRSATGIHESGCRGVCGRSLSTGRASPPFHPGTAAARCHSGSVSVCRHRRVCDGVVSVSFLDQRVASSSGWPPRAYPGEKGLFESQPQRGCGVRTQPFQG